MYNPKYTTEHIVKAIAKAIEKVPRDISAQECAEIINDALSHMVVDENNTEFLSSFLTVEYLNFIENNADKNAEKCEIEEITYTSVVTDFYLYLLDIIQDFILKNIEQIIVSNYNLIETKGDTEDDIHTT